MFNKKLIRIFFTILIIVSSSNLSIVNAEETNGWVENGQTWSYYKDNIMQVNTWVKDSIGQWYYLDETGIMKTNDWLQDSSGRWFYLESNGVMKSNSWIQSSSNQWYYLGSNGAMVTNGWAQDSANHWYYLGIDGTMKKGWLQYVGKWYYLNSDGIMLSNQWLEFKGKSYYLNTNGDMAVNTTTLDGYKVGFDGAWDGNPAGNNTETSVPKHNPGTIEAGFEEIGFIFKSDTVAMYEKDGIAVGLLNVGDYWQLATKTWGEVEESIFFRCMKVILGRDLALNNERYIEYALLNQNSSFRTPNILTFVAEEKLILYIYLPN